ncbi:MAG: hypothetical protein IPN75_19820 [Dechloromonas sp.]|uniref:Uncharacterized protein n=1 Tax=Candidatus Dechloromonas phosphorivorans TaxID=2899244 RepID=A0A9D7LWF6_9RHOO|nr:hypothetical protein [Candidatus Dechloromonas phosphorivorans]
MKTKSLRIYASLLGVAVLVYGGLWFLFLVGIDALEGRNDFQFFADSATYHEAHAGALEHVQSLSDLVGTAGNFLGPMVLLKLAGGNYYLIALLNGLLLGLSIAIISRSLRLDALYLFGLLLLNPITVSSVLSVNKEIISLFCISLLIKAYVSRSFVVLLATILLSLAVRWQLTVVIIFYIMLFLPRNPLRGRRLLTLASLILALSIVYWMLGDALKGVQENFDYAAEGYEGSGLWASLVSLQNDGYYFVALPLKAFHILFGLGVQLNKVLSPVELYNDVWQVLHSTALLVVFVILVKKHLFKLSDNLIFLSLIYIVIFALTPIYAPRYFYPVYVLWVISLSLNMRGRVSLRIDGVIPLGKKI